MTKEFKHGDVVRLTREFFATSPAIDTYGVGNADGVVHRPDGEPHQKDIYYVKWPEHGRPRRYNAHWLEKVESELFAPAPKPEFVRFQAHGVWTDWFSLDDASKFLERSPGHSFEAVQTQMTMTRAEADEYLKQLKPGG